ncbi:MAG TPA: hypothetical protein DCZ01_01620 [Elusimicrobia bacterium]|nr:MAG: hypothetical protein A2X37_07270 [Elusimicrobia bacterium GWA2_66_18]OGR76700.1 MAG: hypothetical protein A2X40_02085 [Elusimicrobia bacterium GWC2_65_9]HAZ07228.1 hypothetical protein [Elusimicrobiota bacterium]
MGRISTLAALVLTLAVPASAQQLMAWPLAASTIWRGFLPHMPLPLLSGPRPTPFPHHGHQPASVLPEDASPVTMADYNVEGIVTDQVAELTYRITFHNPTDRRLEGVLMVPIPADTTLSGFSMMVGGKTTKGELLDSVKAASIYESIVRRAQDPGLLELMGERMLRARVFPIEPKGDITTVLKLTQLLPNSGNLVSLRVPMRSSRFLAGKGGKSSATITLRTTRPLRTIFSPNAEVRVARSDDHNALVTYQEGSAGPQDLALMFSLQKDPLAVGMLSFREEGGDGTVLLTLSPQVKEEATEAAPKDVVFVVDRSGSMQEGGKMEQAKKALQYCVSRLNNQDRFSVVDFATDFNSLEEKLLPADAANKARAQRYIERLEAAGGTNIEGALTEGLRLLGRAEGRVPMVFFLTDGVPTVGQTDVGTLLRRVYESNAGVQARLFGFGVGSDVNTLLLDKLSDGTRGARDYVAPGEDIEVKVSALYQKVSKPALTDVKLAWEGLDVADVFPKPVPDLFHGSELTLYGRFKSAGKGTLVVTGKSGSRSLRFEYPVELPKEATTNSFLPRLWASQKIAHELDVIRLSGRAADLEIVRSIVRLAKNYGIVTPYTSFLVTEEGADMQSAEREASRRFGRLSSIAAASGFSGGALIAKKAQLDSNRVAALRGSLSHPGAAPSLSSFEESTRAELKEKGISSVETRSIGGKTFYHRAARWVDSEVELEEFSGKTVDLTARSVEYFDLVAREPGLARVLSLGDEVTVLWRGVLYRVVKADSK